MTDFFLPLLLPTLLVALQHQVACLQATSCNWWAGRNEGVCNNRAKQVAGVSYFLFQNAVFRKSDLNVISPSDLGLRRRIAVVRGGVAKTASIKVGMGKICGVGSHQAHSASRWRTAPVEPLSAVSLQRH